MITYLLIALAVLVAAFVVVAALQPATYKVTRSLSMSAPPSVIFGVVNDLRRFNDYSPWAGIDPGTRYTYGGPPAGPGAFIEWAGNKKVGSGRMSLIASQPNARIGFKLEFFTPMASVAECEWTFRVEGTTTQVAWSISGHNNFVAKALCLFMNMDKMLGPQFEQGLAKLRTLVETETRA